MPTTFVYTAIPVKKQMPVEKSCSAVLNVHPVQPATKPVRTVSYTHLLGNTLKKLKENGVNIHPALENAFKQLYGYTSDSVSYTHLDVYKRQYR